MPTIEELEKRPLSTNPDDYEGLRPYAPGTLGARSGDPLPGWSDTSIPAAARVSSFMRQKIGDRKNLPDFKDEFKSTFGSMPNKALEDMFFVERGVQMPELSATEGSWRSQLVDELTHRAPFMGQVYSAKETNEYEAAEKRLEAGEATERDKGLIINYRLRQNRLRQKEESDKAFQAANFLGGLAAQGAEFLSGGGAAGQLVKKTGLTGGALFGARAAGTAAAVPTMGAYEKTYEFAAKGGRETPSATDIVQGFTVGLINSAVAGTVEQFGAGKLGKLGMGTGAAGVAGRIGAGAVGGTIEDDIATALLKNMSLETRYGPMLELLQGKGGDNWSRLAHSLIGEGIFAGVGAMRPDGHFDAERMQKVVDAGAKAIDAGLTPEEASGVLDAYHEALHRGEPAPKFRERDLDPVGKDRRRVTRKQLNQEGRILLDVLGEALEADMSPAKKALVEDLAKTLPEEADPFHGLSGQQIKDTAKAAGIDTRQSIADLKQQIVDSPVGRAMLQAEGRLESEKPTEAQKPPESPQEAEKPPEAPKPQEGGDRPVAAVTDAQVELWRRAILAGKMPAGVEVADWIASEQGMTPAQAKEIALRLTGPDLQNLGVRERQVQKARERAKTTQAKPGAREAGKELRQEKPVESPAKRTYKLTPAQKRLRERIVIAGAVSRMGRQAADVGEVERVGPKSKEQASREMLVRRAMYQQNRLDRRVREKLKERQAARKALERSDKSVEAIESAEGEQEAAKGLEDYGRGKEAGDLGTEGEYKPGEEDIPAAPPQTPSMFPVGTGAAAVKITNVGKASDAHVKEVQDVLEHIPDEIHQAFNDAGGTIETGEMISDIEPGLKGVEPTGWPPGTTWDNADGLYATGTKKIYSASHNLDMADSMYGKKDTKVASQRVAGTLRHEYGHAVDYLMTVMGQPFSKASAAFRDAWAADMKKLTPEQIVKFDYYTTNRNALAEVFAEAFALKFGGGADSRNVVKTYFPNAAKVADAAIERFIHARKSKQGAGGGIHPGGSNVGGKGSGGGLVSSGKSGGGFLGWSHDELIAMGEGGHDLEPKRLPGDPGPEGSPAPRERLKG